MDDVCVCSLEPYLNSILEKTKISLPVLVAACALGYLWIARKNTKDMMKQCVILEDDVRQLERGNFLLEEEIKRLKCTTSDTYLLSSDFNKFRVNNTQHKAKKYCASKCDLEMSFPNSPRYIGRKMKVRKSKLHPPCDDAEHFQMFSYSTPDVRTKLPCRASPPMCNNIELPPYVLCPHDETNKVSVNCNECDFLKPGRISFNQKCFEQNLKENKFFKENRHSLKRPCTPDPILESLNCYKYSQKTKPKLQRNKPHDCKSDFIINCKKYTTDCGLCSKLKKSQCDSKNRNFNDPFSTCENPCNCINQNNYDDYPMNVSRNIKLNDNIERFRSKLAKELGALEKEPNSLLERKKKKLCDKAALDLKTLKSCGFYDNDIYSFKH